VKTTIENVLVSHDYGREVYDVIMTARHIHRMSKHGLLVIDPEHQRGTNSVTGAEIVNQEKVNRWTQQLLDDRAVFGQLTWNFRPEETTTDYNPDTGEFIIDDGAATLPDSAHRHRAIVNAVDSIARGSSFDIDTKFSVRIWRVSAEVENDLFYGMNQEGDKADATRSKWLTQKNVGQKIAVQVVRTSPHLTDSNVETVSNTLSARNPRLAAFNTISKGFEDAWEDTDPAEIDGAAEWFISFWEKLVEVRPQLGKLSLPDRQKARKESIGASALAVHGYIRLARQFYDDADFGLERLEELADDDFFKIDSPHWQARGIVVTDTNQAGLVTRSVRNAMQTRRAMTDALAAKVGLITDPLATAGESEDAATAA
jgi:DndB-like DNA-sulfur modification-associated protein